MESYSVAGDKRFAFGENWLRFLDSVDEGRIESSMSAIAEMEEVDDLLGRSFLDVGCGSGLSSLAARRLGASVHSFDYDAASVAAAEEMRRRYAPDDLEWTIEQGSILDREYVSSLGRYDVVYSWGVLHHTGDLDTALDHVVGLVAPDGLLHLAIYNDQGRMSEKWRAIKRRYVEAGPAQQRLLEAYVSVRLGWRAVAARLVGRRRGPLGYGKEGDARGMSWWHDIRDWVGGYPFEVAKPEEIVARCRAHGFQLRSLRTVGGGHGCNEFVFEHAPQNSEGGPSRSDRPALL